jgi:hypothetical protein
VKSVDPQKLFINKDYDGFNLIEYHELLFRLIRSDFTDPLSRNTIAKKGKAGIKNRSYRLQKIKFSKIKMA